MKSVIKIFLLFFSGIYWSACERDIITNPPLNQAPIAKAGNDTSLLLPFNSIVLDGSGSYDPEGKMISYFWAKISGPPDYTISNPNAVRPEIGFLWKGLHQFELTVRDDGFLTGKDTLTVAVDILPCEFRPFIYARLVPITKLSQARSDMMIATANGKILCAGGISSQGLSSNRVDIYDINSGTSTTGELSRDWFGDRYGMAIASANNKVFFAGGGEPIGGDGSSIIDIYDASSNNWSKATLSQGRMELVAVSLNNKVFFAGGGYIEPNSPYNWINSALVDIYDMTTGTWTTAKLSEGRLRIGGISTGDKIYFAGGLTTKASDKIDVYDAKTNSWTTDALIMPRASFSSIVADNKIFWAGGLNSGWVNNVEVRDLKTGVSTLVCIEPRYKPQAVIKDDYIIFFTGFGFHGQFRGRHFDIYNITTGSWSTGVLTQSLYDASVISINNTIYVAGGRLNDELTDQVWKLEF